MSGDAIRAELVGNTYSGVTKSGFHYTEYLHPEGRIRAEDYFGWWSISGDQLCLDYDGGVESDGCWAIALDGDRILWLKGEEQDDVSTLVAGNPHNL